MKAQDEADRIEQEVKRRVQERLEQERAARKPPIYRSTLTPKQKSELMRKMGPERYLRLPSVSISPATARWADWLVALLLAVHAHLP